MGQRLVPRVMLLGSGGILKSSGGFFIIGGVASRGTATGPAHHGLKSKTRNQNKSFLFIS
jgi:hypothetical protein